MEKIKQMLEIAELAYRAHERLHELKKTYDVTVYFQFDCRLLEIIFFHNDESGKTDEIRKARISWEIDEYYGRVDKGNVVFFKVNTTVAIEKITENLKMIAKYGDDKLLDDPVWDIYSFKDLSEEEK